jgi:hypothetical protein
VSKRRALWLAGGVFGVLAAFVFLWWAIQTVWLGSFPGRDVESYSLWALVQLLACVGSLILAVLAFVKSARSR